MPPLVIHLRETLIYFYKKPRKRILSTTLFEAGKIGNNLEVQLGNQEINCGLFINQS